MDLLQSWRWFLTKNLQGKNLGPSEGSSECTKLGHGKGNGFTEGSVTISWVIERSMGSLRGHS